MTKFKVGDICIVHSITFEPHMRYNGEEITITSLPHSSQSDVYGIKGDLPEGIRACNEKYLRLKRDTDIERGNMDRVIKWEDCSWRPKGKENE